MTEMKTLLRRWANRLWVLPQARVRGGLAVYPIYAAPRWHVGRQDALDYIPLSEAMGSAQAVVTEMPSAHVPELLVKNQGPVAVLGVDGDELLGGRQNRVLNASVLLGAGETRVPVSCVEQGRWAQRSVHFRGGERLPHNLRTSSHGHVTHNLHSHGGHASDQRAIWREIEHGHRQHGTHSSTGSMHDWYRAQEEALGACEKALPYPPGAVGLAVSLGGRVVGCDVFDRPTTAEHYWPRILRACAAEAAHYRVPPVLPPEPPERLLSAVRSCELEVFDSPGLGTDIRLRGPGLSGSALVYQNVVVHLGLFTAPEGAAQPGATS